MPVRDSTEWRHAILHKKAINHDRGGTYVMCGWDDCTKDGYEMYKAVEFLGYEPIIWEGRIQYLTKTLTFIFCSQRHKDYFQHSTVRANMLPPGSKSAIV
jgi:hypothetical protein